LSAQQSAQPRLAKIVGAATSVHLALAGAVKTAQRAMQDQPAMTAVLLAPIAQVQTAQVQSAHSAMVAATGLLVKSQLATVPMHLVKIAIAATLTTHVAQTAPIA
jgi:hypothetical protein